MKEVYIILLSLLVIIWWMGIWSSIDIIITMHTKNNPMHALYVYSSMAILVLILFIMNPNEFRNVITI
jgi:hypothetical protein